jgi:PhzF family phenazine biosynthesis protein
VKCLLNIIAFIKQMNKSKIIYQVDAFTSEPFRGNPAAVCILDKEPDASWMQNVAMEMNLSETAFVFHKGGSRNIRFFTPAAEIDLCGHATLSASHILYEYGFCERNEKIVFHSKAGELTVETDGKWITMNFPSYPVTPNTDYDEFSRVTGARASELYTSVYGWTMALLGSEKEVRDMRPDFKAMKGSQFGDLIVTAPASGEGYDFCVRCFVPALGIDEDPVTGSAHCALTPFWHSRTGKKEFISHQVSARGGILKVSVDGERVKISGQARTILKAELLV